MAQSSDVTNVSNPSQSTSRQAYKTEIVGGVVVHTTVQQVKTSLFIVFTLVERKIYEHKSVMFLRAIVMMSSRVNPGHMSL